MLEWILDNLRLVFFLVIGLIWLISAMSRGRKARQDAMRRPVSPSPTITAQPHADADEFERTRRIQEEIRRKILARQRGEPPPAPVRPAYDAEQEVEELEPEYMEEGPRPRPAPPPLPPAASPSPWDLPGQTPPPLPAGAESSAAAAILERQRMLEEQLRAVRAAQALASGGLPSIATTAIGERGAARGRNAVKREIRRELARPGTIRRAILLREILGEPVGLQRNPTGGWRR